jgi:hypothetical protein
MLRDCRSGILRATRTRRDDALLSITRNGSCTSWVVPPFVLARGCRTLSRIYWRAVHSIPRPGFFCKTCLEDAASETTFGTVLFRVNSPIPGPQELPTMSWSGQSPAVSARVADLHAGGGKCLKTAAGFCLTQTRSSTPGHRLRNLCSTRLLCLRWDRFVLPYTHHMRCVLLRRTLGWIRLATIHFLRLDVRLRALSGNLPRSLHLPDYNMLRHSRFHLFCLRGRCWSPGRIQAVQV